MEKVAQHTCLHQAEPLDRGSLAIEAPGADIARMQPVVLQVEKGHCQRLAKAFAVAQADAIEHGTGIEHAAEG